MLSLRSLSQVNLWKTVPFLLISLPCSPWAGGINSFHSDLETLPGFEPLFPVGVPGYSHLH